MFTLLLLVHNVPITFFFDDFVAIVVFYFSVASIERGKEVGEDI